MRGRAMTDGNRQWLKAVFSELMSKPHPAFSGLGLILYHPPLALPVLSLASDEHPLKLPTRTRSESIDLLKTITSGDSEFHDGFHLVDADTLFITHVSQFFAPPIPEGITKPVCNHPIGARFVAAWLGSLLPGVSITATLSKREGGLIFDHGCLRSITEARN